ncbi:MAG: parallel beta-helix domain-containing protein [Lewinella sp.]|jgi:parallel beta-helix repeat protein|uniref:parallel beta-helix domain-containing protein n=1 Tax=Lewinella sp. TaxID=2004506 RepID=UPI003D6B65FF
MKKFLKNTGITLAIFLVAGLIWWFVSDYQVYENRPQKPLDEYVDLEADFQKLFQLAQDGETIELPAGHFKFSKALILDGKNNITIKGAGMDKTVLSFRGQTEGAEGIRVANGHNITLEDFTVQDAIGDNIKAIYIDTIIFRNLKTEWTDVPNTTLGAYGLYPVICKNVLIENCEALRGSDSGLYVGQSQDVVIRNNITTENVCGINVENSGNVDIYNNKCFNNTSGITALDIPGLTRYMDDIRIHDNQIYENTLYNFAPAGNVAASTVAGTGITLWAAKNVSVYDNEIVDNPFPIVMFSFVGTNYMAKDKEYAPVAASERARNEVSAEEEASLREDVINAKWSADENYNPYNVDISFRNNKWSFGSFRKKLQTTGGALFTLATWGKNAHLWYDGVDNPDGSTVCIDGNNDFIVVNLDIMNDSKNIEFKELMTKCSAD